ncbi:MAG: class I SAM-dependent methyltransferase [Proteobacteria bacterium]|nr:class I SAM-dependent methyltransferase [Pseudomonadota bacterium]MBI3496493.1 class I SAM-dependent methyltransferase [Pseudomonadota bacterium]
MPQTPACDSSPQVSSWVERFARLVPSGGTVLDLAAGSGRHTRFFRRLGYRVLAVDRDIAGLADLAEDAAVEVVAADLESGAPWPLGQGRFAGVVVANYLWRPLLPAILGAVAPGGALLYETFAVGNERFGRPRNPDFLLRPGELLEAVHGALAVIAYEHLEVATPRPALVQRIAAIKPAG